MSDWFRERAGLDGAVALVVGGAGGLGLASTEDLAANGMHVAVLDKDDAAVDALRAAQPDALVHLGDAREAAVLAALFDAVDERFGRLDVLVNVVGGTFKADFADTTPNGWDALVRLNLLPVLHACSLAIPRMRAGGRGGSIVNISTIEAHRAAPGFAVYSAAKAAVEQFARTLALELAPDRIRVNNVAPDFTWTPNLLRGAPADTHPMGHPDTSAVNVPLGRPGRMGDVSGCVVFLASGLSEFVTGTTLHPDGGTSTARGWFNWPGEGWLNHIPYGDVDAIAERTRAARPRTTD